MNKLKLGLLTAIFPEMSFEEVILYAKNKGLSAVELACWPNQKENRRYAGTSHLDVNNLSDEKVSYIKEFLDKNGISISSLGYYPNPLHPDLLVRQNTINHLKKLITASKKLNINMITTFIGRNKYLSYEENMLLFVDIWKPIIIFAESLNVKIAIENCPMYFTYDEYPNGLNLAISPKVFKEMFDLIPNQNFGLNFDPSHFVWQHMDYINVLEVFKERLFHIHIKDAKVDQEKLNQYGILVPPLYYMSPKLPGLGDINWEAFIQKLYDINYQGYSILEIEDKSYESSFDLIDQGIEKSIQYIKKKA